ncbi:MAG: agmatine deiminase family protein [Candidatus Saccharibacteria bacterium]
MMNRKYALVVITCFLVVCGLMGCGTAGKKPINLSGSASWRFPGEFEKQQAIWLMWPSEVYQQGDRNVVPDMTNIIRSLAKYIKVNVMVDGESQMEDIKTLLKNAGYTGTNIKYYVISHQSIWARDVGPIFVKGTDNRLRVVNFGFNNYSRDGDPEYIRNEGQVDRRSAELLGLPVIDSRLMSEGGAIESNGKGTLMMTEAVVLKRNPGMSKLEIENEYKRVLGVKKIVWLKKGLAEDDAITSGHINEIARFADARTVLLVQVLPGDRNASTTAQESYRRMEENYSILKSATDQDGKPFRIIRVPIPPTFYAQAGSSGSVPVRSYVNYAVTNGAVVMPQYWRPGRPEAVRTTDIQAKQIIGRAYPGREIIGVDDESINLWGGGIHCITQHMPAI